MSQQAPLDKAVEVFRPGSWPGPTILSEKIDVELEPLNASKHHADYEQDLANGTDLKYIKLKNESPADRTVFLARDETRRLNPRNRRVWKLGGVIRSAAAQWEPDKAAHIFGVVNEDGIIEGGFRMYVEPTRWVITVVDVFGNEHNTEWVTTGEGYNDEQDHHFMWTFNKNNDRINLEVDGDSKTTSPFNMDYNQLKSINPDNPTVLLGGIDLNSGTNTRYNGYIGDIAIGRRNYEWPSPF